MVRRALRCDACGTEEGCCDAMHAGLKKGVQQHDARGHEREPGRSRPASRHCPKQLQNNSRGGGCAGRVVTEGRVCTGICLNWQNTGQCTYDLRCNFAHGAHELRVFSHAFPLSHVHGRRVRAHTARRVICVCVSRCVFSAARRMLSLSLCISL
eukprot:2121961-Rhodomonas_salina.3